MMRLWIIGCVLFLTTSWTQAQNVSMTSADKDTIVFGDLIQLNYTLSSIPSDCKSIVIDLGKVRNKMYDVDSAFFEEFADISVERSDGTLTDYYDQSTNSLSIPTSALVNNEGQSLVVPVHVYSFGDFEITPARLLDQNDSILPLIAQSGSFVVLIPNHIQQDTSLVIADIKPIKEVKKPIWRLLMRILLGLIVLAVLWYFWKKYLRRENTDTAEQEEDVVHIPAHVRALEDLFRLRASRKWETGESKEFQSELTNIIRTYLEERYSIPALELTSDEIIELIRKKSLLSKTWSSILDDILHIADLVKFAKAEPDHNIHTDFLDKSVDFVNSTKEKGGNG
ncbi:MAG: hypothetical protein KDC49_20840 [Saprospiraceae bacterium]|nr:hypothetical protein [Saprospiraceae bacterium]